MLRVEVLELRHLEEALGVEVVNADLTKSFCKSQFPHKSVNLSFIIADINDKLTNLCGN